MKLGMTRSLDDVANKQLQSNLHDTTLVYTTPQLYDAFLIDQTFYC